MKLEKATVFVLAFLLFYFAFLLAEYPKYGVFWDEGGHLSNGFFVGEGIKTFVKTLSVQQTVDHLKQLSEQYNIFQVLHYPPLFYTLEGVLFAGMGPSELPGKVLSMLFSVGAIFVTYLLGKKIYGTRAGVISALFLAASPLFFRESLMAMMDSASAFLFVLSIYVFILFLNGRTSHRKFGVVFGVAMLTRFESILLIPIMLAYLFVTKTAAGRFRKVAAALLIGILMASPWYLISMGKPDPEKGIRLLQYLDGLLFKWHFGGASTIFDPTYFGKMLFPSLSAIAASLGLSGMLWILSKRGQGRSEELLLLLWPMLVYLFLSIIVTRLPRYSIGYLPAFALMAGGFTDRIGELLGKKLHENGAVLIIVLVSVLVSVITYEKNIDYLDAQFANYRYRIAEVEQAAGYIARNAGGERIFQLSFRNEIGPATIPFYLMTGHPNSGIMVRNLQSFQIPETGNIALFKYLLERYCPKYIITLDNKQRNDNAQSIENVIKIYNEFVSKSEKFTPDEKFDGIVADILIYKRTTPDCAIES